jgi:hypothetical protein
MGLRRLGQHCFMAVLSSALTLSEPDPGVLTGIDPGTC